MSTPGAADLLRIVLARAPGRGGAELTLVLDAPGLADLPEEVALRDGRVQVRRVGTELALRRLLYDAGGERVVAVVPEPLARDLPMDLLRRSRGQRVHTLALRDALEVVLGTSCTAAAEVPPLRSLVERYLAELSRVLGRRTLPTMVDEALLGDLLVEAATSEDLRRTAPGELLAAWVRSPLRRDDGLRELVRQRLERIHGADGVLLGRALAEDRLDELLVRGAVFSVAESPLPEEAWGPLWAWVKDEPDAGRRQETRRRVRALGEAALRGLQAGAAGYLEKANTVARKLGLNTRSSPLLPLGLRVRAAELVRRAAAGEPVSRAEVVELRGHLAARSDKPLLRLVAGVARLSRWLAAEGERERQPWPADTEGWCGRYHTGLAYADLAARMLREALGATAEHRAEADEVLRAYQARRDDADRAFAGFLASRYTEAVFREGLGLHRVAREVLAPALERSRCYLVVLDGCSLPVFLSLLFDLAAADLAVGLADPAAGDPAAQGLLPALALLPSVTSHSRGALFQGSVPGDPLVPEATWRGGREAATDKARLTGCPALGDHTRRLFLKGDLADGGEALLAALADPGCDLVAAVFNAVDDHVGSRDTGSVRHFTPHGIAHLVPSLEVALAHGRRVLVAADHGHTLHQGKELRLGEGKAHRYRVLEPGEAPPEGTVVVDVGDLPDLPAGRVAFCWRAGAYFGTVQAGYHGGCSLEEMVVPLAWLERGGVEHPAPPWWYDRAVTEGDRGAQRGTEAKVAGPEPAQAELFSPRSPPDRAATAACLPLPAAALDALDDGQRAALAELAQRHVLSQTELAALLGRQAGRMPGYMAKLARRLAAAGGAPFETESLPSGEQQYRWTGAVPQGERQD